MEITAKLKYYRTAPRKVRLVADLVRGKKLGEAMKFLMFSTKKSSRDIAKLLKSAASNAKNDFKVVDTESLYINKITVDEGPTLKRFMPRARGSASSIKKRTSHVSVVLGDKKQKKNV